MPTKPCLLAELDNKFFFCPADPSSPLAFQFWSVRQKTLSNLDGSYGCMASIVALRQVRARQDLHGDGGLQSRDDQFLGLYATHTPWLRSYLLALVPSWIDAEEIFQRCAVLLWEKFDQFEPGTNFEAWACHIVRLEATDFVTRLSKAD